MRHSIAVKFVALCLAAISLLAVLGSAAGIIVLAAMDLYEESVEDQYNESMQATRQDFAVQLLHRYACLELGKLPEQYLNDYRGTDWMYNIFQYGTYYYTIRNEHGQAVESTMANAPEGGTTYEMVVTKLCYRALMDYLVETPQGLVPSEGTEPIEPPATTEPPATSEPPATTGPVEETQDSDQSVAAVETAPTMPNTAQRETEIIQDAYFDYEQEKTVYFTFLYRELPPYTVELYLLPNAAPEEYAWTLLHEIWNIRYQLFWVLGISALCFAVCMVWLCICAGRKKDCDEIRAGGLNCVPLDLYLVGAGLLVCSSVYGGMHLLYYLLREMPKILIPTVLLGGFALCLLVVAFFFACAAQFKTENSYWWHNSLTGRCLRLIVWLWNKSLDICIWIFSRLPGFLKRLFGLGKAAVLWGLNLCRRILRRLWYTVREIFRWLGGKMAHFYGLLPLIWQWILTGAVLMGGLAFAMLERSEGLMVLMLCLGIITIFYGASCFGTLLDAAKRMGKGDLETKVSDKNMVGAFKDFAGDLNALADVAVVAARNQLKSERMKTELITNVSHDIKTPLTSIINYVDLLQKPHTEEEQEQYLEVLSRQSGQLKKLIEDLMEMSKASTGNMAVDITAVNAVEAVNQALGEFADKFERIQLTPVFRQPEENLYMKADGRLAWRVLSNLLSNAYKYALPGTRLYIDLQELEGKVLISLKNISREELNVSADELLERFVRGDVSRNTEGSGLGLNIAQSLMELQKGQLQLLVDGDLFKVTLVFPAARIE